MFGKNKRRPAYRPAPEERPIIPLPAETSEDRDALRLAERERNHWLDEAYETFVRNGGLEHLPGWGKPLVVPSGDPLTTILRSAGMTHPWIEFRKEIRCAIEETLKRMEVGAPAEEIDARLRDINADIEQMNLQAPSMSLHRRKINRDNIRAELAKWM